MPSAKWPGGCCNGPPGIQNLVWSTHMRMVSARYCMFLLIALMAGSSSSAPSRMVAYRSGPDTVRGYLTTPDGTGPFPALIVIHEWWGLNDWVKEKAGNLSEQGFVTLAIDLYRGQVATSPEEAHEIMRGLPEDRAVRDLKAAFEYLRSRDDVDSGSIGSIGWCMGGGYSLAAATNIPDLAAGVICYGRLVTDTVAINQIHAPLLGIFGEDDRGISPASVHSFEETATALGKNVTVKIYPGCGHAFMNESNKNGYRAEATHDAWDQIRLFLGRLHRKK
jgi:carboxymethylenebutenolidase